MTQNYAKSELQVFYGMTTVISFTRWDFLMLALIKHLSDKWCGMVNHEREFLPWWCCYLCCCLTHSCCWKRRQKCLYLSMPSQCKLHHVLYVLQSTFCAASVQQIHIYHVWHTCWTASLLKYSLTLSSVLCMRLYFLRPEVSVTFWWQKHATSPCSIPHTRPTVL